ncbi:neuronal calcium sensor 2 [Eurytemora carolleeae]|uniref:neuronal calcium sensor 2 n=1 Tax=Eurytemora carolleeae TaxID=1294199 RepID=UPI000C7874F9|nr:neuronal calcium sensor 2 [Eurytemora carolleeae]|eukprot:XP_023347991.1 neuronal calcium sensor 2-like [Eurytemora affinis]
MKKLDKKTEQFLLSKTQFNVEEIQDWFTTFSQECPNGLLLRDKVDELFKEMNIGGQDLDQFLQDVFKLFDRECVGGLTFVQFMLASDLMGRRPVEARIRWNFHLFDSDGSGSIDSGEIIDLLLALMTSTGRKTSRFDVIQKSDELFGGLKQTEFSQVTDLGLGLFLFFLFVCSSF